MLQQPQRFYEFGPFRLDAVITRLSSTGKIIVRPTSAISRYTAPDQDPLAAGREQRVDAVLDSSIWRSGEKIRLTTRLLNVRDGMPLWPYSCEEFYTDVFAAQTLISERMAEALIPQLTGAEKARLRKRHTENPEANRLYLLGRYHWNRRTNENLKKGIAFFQQALEKDPTYALAYAGMAECYTVQAGYPSGDARESRLNAKAYATRAIEIDEALAEAHTTLAGIRFSDEWDWPGAEKGYKRAIELDPGYATAHQRYSLFLMSVGRTEEALAEIKRALELDPVSIPINASLGWRLSWARRYDQAIEQLQKTLEMDPNYGGVYLHLGEAYAQKGMYAEAITALNRAIELSRDRALVSLGYCYAVSGRRSEAERVLVRLSEISRQQNISSEEFAVIYSGLGEKDQAFAWLEKAYHERSGRLVFLKVEPMYDSLRSDPRFANLLRRIGLAP